jgi:hypothetical protein
VVHNAEMSLRCLVWLSFCILAFAGTGCKTRTPGTTIARLKPAHLIQFRGAHSETPEKPGTSDCNSPAHWDGAKLYVFNSAGHPWRSSGPDLGHLNSDYRKVAYNNEVQGGRWIEGTWEADDGVLYGWYHFEPAGICAGMHPTTGMSYTAPRIGALKSLDNGASWQDLGIVLEASPESYRCDTKNFYFVGGIGDFSVMLDRGKRYLYFFISTYSRNVEEQGVSIARMKWEDRDNPIGKVWKWHAGSWGEPGLDGHVTPIFRAKSDWHERGPDAFWGPSIHWNTHLKRYVMLLNRANDERWRQEGIYVSFSKGLTDPGGWSEPKKILGLPEEILWYPQVIGLEPGGTDKLAGRSARFFLSGKSEWEIEFELTGR